MEAVQVWPVVYLGKTAEIKLRARWARGQLLFRVAGLAARWRECALTGRLNGVRALQRQRRTVCG